MALGDARAIVPDLQSRPFDADTLAGFLQMLARWMQRYCPWVTTDGVDGLLLDITGAAHLWGGETALLDDIGARLARSGLTARFGLADTRGAAWALARFGTCRIAAVGETRAALAPLPVAALRLEPDLCAALERVGLKTVGEVQSRPRAPLARRFGPAVFLQLDRALGLLPEPVSPAPETPNFAIRMTLPEPVGLFDDVMALLDRLLARLCQRLEGDGKGARRLRLTFGRVDQTRVQAEIGLARPMRDAGRILALFARAVQDVDAGFGIERLRLEALEIEPLELQQLAYGALSGGASTRAGFAGEDRALSDLLTRLGNRVGFDNITRLLPADSHIPEQSYLVAPAAHSLAAATDTWFHAPNRPLAVFPPEPVAADNARPPRRFRWRGMWLSVLRAEGPERILPQWWLPDPAWRGGLRDYWQVQTLEGRRLWLFHTPQNPGWFVQGVFA